MTPEDCMCLVKERQPEKEVDENGGLGPAHDGDEGERVDGSNHLFLREAPILTEESRISKDYSCQDKKVGAREELVLRKDMCKQGTKLSRRDRVELGCRFQRAVSSCDWELAWNLLVLAKAQALNDVLCVALDSVWFLTTHEELDGITGLIKKIIGDGANDFTRAILRTSFLASCVSACQSKMMNLTDAVGVTTQRLHERLQECQGDEVLKVAASTKVQKFTEWALKCIRFHSHYQENRGRRRRNQSTIVEVQLQLSAFKTFLELAGDHLTGKDFTEAFDAACFPVALFSSSFDPGWASGISAIAVQGLLGMLVEGGADNVNQCFLEASRFGSTELVRILLQIAQRNSLDIDVDLALVFASHYCKIRTMECLVEEGNAANLLGPLVRASERGCMQVVQWFVNQGCGDMDLCLALIAATSSSHLGVSAYLLSQIPHHVLSAVSIEILKTVSERSRGSLDGVAFLLCNDFLGDPTATYAVADSIASSNDEVVAPELRAFLKEHWSEDAFAEGLSSGQDHYVNFMRILQRGGSPICLMDLPPPLVTAIVYKPLYRECTEAGGKLLPQKLRGKLVEAASRLGGRQVDNDSPAKELLAILEHHLPRHFLPL
ncbi:ankyrin repeat protein SKIP35-like [Musa acuminata AAA Group]|uniref:ankyrin repeat protein SKIP35-like n=1 Tax=Musa acuminata AAA Group TaxID=214697 RepID=UPI0031D16DFB